MATPNKKACKTGDIRTYFTIQSKIRSDADGVGGGDKGSDEESSGDETSAEDGDDRSSRVICESTDADDTTEKLLNIMSIYKIMNSRLEGRESVSDIETLKIAIIKTLESSKKLEQQHLKRTSIGHFSVLHFFYCTKEKNNRNAATFTQELKADQSEFPGDRKSGNVFAFYRYTVKEKQYEIFLACDGNTWKYILYLADPEFRTNMAKTYIDDENILEIEKFCLAGAYLSQKTIFKKKESIYINQWEQYVAHLTSVLRTETRLYELLVKKTEKTRNKSQILIEFGLNKVRILIKMKKSTLADVLYTISRELENTSNDERPLIQTLESVQRIQDMITRKELDTKMCEKFIQAIKGTEMHVMDDLYLSHRLHHDFHTSSSFTLKVQKKTDKELKQRNKTEKDLRSVPTIHDVVSIIKEHFRSNSDSDLTDSLNNKCIKLIFNTQEETICEPIQNYIHGCIQVGETRYYRLYNKWFKCSSSFFDTIDRNFNIFAENCKFQKDEKECVSKILKYPWQYDSGIDVKKHCTILDMNHVQLEELITILCKEVDIVKDGRVCITDASFLIPEVAVLCKQMEIIQAQETHSDPPASTSTTKKAQKIKEKKAREILETCRLDLKRVSKKIQELLEKPLKVCCKDPFKVMNPVLTETLWTEISKTFPHLKQNDVLTFLKSLMGVSEGDFNELYLLCELSGYIVFPGDRVLANNIELFDVLIHDTKKNKTFLIHNKDKLNGNARISCAQIRTSAEILWHDFVRGHDNHLSQWWETATTTDSEGVYRQMLKNKLKGIDKDTFLQMFSEKNTIVFVLGFRSRNKKPCLSFDFRPIKAQDFERSKGLKPDCDEVFKILVEEKYITKTGFLTDRMLTITSAEKFMIEWDRNKTRTDYKKNVKEMIYSKLARFGMCNLSTIAKLELLTLDSTFSRFQIGGRRHFELRLLQYMSS